MQELNVNLGKWWTDNDINKLKKGELETLFKQFDFLRLSPLDESIYIGNGEIGGYIDGLGSNSTTFSNKAQEPDCNIKDAFQSIDMFSSYGGFNSRVYNLQFIVQPLIDDKFDPDLIKEYKQTQSLWNAEVQTEFVYSNLKFNILSAVSWAERRLVFFNIYVKNNGRDTIKIEILTDIKDKNSPGEFSGTMTFEYADGIKLGKLDAVFSKIQAACSSNENIYNLKPGQTCEFTAYFSISTNYTDISSLDVVNAAQARNFTTILNEHRKAAHERWSKTYVLIPDWNLQRMYLQAIYMSLGNVGGKFIGQASMLGAGGWSGTGYSWDTLFPMYALLRTGHYDKLKVPLMKILNDIQMAERKFINFAYDINCTEGSGRYRNELHESAAGPAVLMLICDYARMIDDIELLQTAIYPVLKDVCKFFIKTLEKHRGLYKKNGVYRLEYKHIATCIVRSVESDRRPGWFTDTAMAFKDLLLKTVEIGEKYINGDDKVLNELKEIADKMHIPQTNEYYQMFDSDNFPDVPRTGWHEKKWNFHASAVGAFPFTIAIGDEKAERSLQFIFTQPIDDLSTYGGYPMIQLLAAARMRLTKFLQKILYDRQTVYYGNKVNVNTGNSKSDTNSFIMSFGALALTVQEMLLAIYDDVIRPFPSIINLFLELGVYFKLPAYGGIMVTGNINSKYQSVELNSDKDQKISLEVPYWWKDWSLIEEGVKKTYTPVTQIVRKNGELKKVTVISFTIKIGKTIILKNSNIEYKN